MTHLRKSARQAARADGRDSAGEVFVVFVETTRHQTIRRPSSLLVVIMGSSLAASASPSAPI